MWLCKTCKAANDDTDLRCVVCGRYADQIDGEKQYCTNCGTIYKISVYHRYCINCGHKFED